MQGPAGAGGQEDVVMETGEWNLFQTPVGNRIKTYVCPDATKLSGINCNALSYYVLGLVSGDAALGYTEAMAELMGKARDIEKKGKTSVDADEDVMMENPDLGVPMEIELEFDLTKPRWRTLEGGAYMKLFKQMDRLACGVLDPLTPRQIAYATIEEPDLPSQIRYIGSQLTAGNMCGIGFRGRNGAHAIVLAKNANGSLVLLDPQRGRRMFGDNPSVSAFYTSLPGAVWTSEYFAIRFTLDDVTPFITYIEEQGKKWNFYPNGETPTLEALCTQSSYTFRGPIPYPADINHHSAEYGVYRKSIGLMEVEDDLSEFFNMPMTVSWNDSRFDKTTLSKAPGGFAFAPLPKRGGRRTKKRVPKRRVTHRKRRY